MNDCNYNRDCTKVPIPGKCVTYCLERILRSATIEEKQLILGLDRSLSLVIYNAYNGVSDINSFEDLRRQLTPDQAKALLDRFAQINQFQLNYFRQDRSQRESIVRAIRNMGLE